MSLTGEEAFALSKKYTKETAEGMGAIKGDDGFSPIITENTGNTDSDYRLDITTANASFTTDNLKGPKGDKGVKGDNGAKGEAGATYTPEIGNVSSGETASASVSVNTETKKAKFSFVLPKGEKGDKGDKGEKGNPGADGAKGEQGAQGVQGVQGIQGEKGDDGYPFLIYKEYTSLSEFNSSDFPEIGLMFMIKEADATEFPVYRYTGDNTTPYSFVTDLTGGTAIKGDKGDKGDQGAQGVKGNDGITYVPKIGSVTSGETASASVEINEEQATASFSFVIPGAENAQSDWNETDTTSDSYIKNKPTIPTVPTKVSELENDSNYISSIPEEYVTETELTGKDYAKTADVVAKEEGKSLVSDTDITQISTNKNAIETLNGDKTKEGSVQKQISDALDNFPKATNEAPGISKPDGKTIYIISNGTLSIADHRNTYVREFLGNSVDEYQRKAIQDGTFKDLYTGMYWTINDRNWLITDMDYWLNTGNTVFTKHHLNIIPEESLYNAQMNTTNTTVGGYVGSYMYKNGLNQAKQIANEAFGDMVLTHREYLVNAVSNGKPSGGGWFDSTVELPNEIMIYGHPHLVPACDGTTIPALYTINKSQLALYSLRPDLISNRDSYWLRDVVSSDRFASVGGVGYAACDTAAYSLGVHPVFPIG